MAKKAALINRRIANQRRSENGRIRSWRNSIEMKTLKWQRMSAKINGIRSYTMAEGQRIS